MKHWTCNITSLLPVAALIFLWATSYRTDRRMGYVHRDVRYTIHLHHGHLRLTAPPPNLRRYNPELLRISRLLRNDQLKWRVYFRDGHPTSFGPDLNMDASPQRFLARPRALRDGPLLTALERPDAYIAAHTYLSKCYLHRYRVTSYQDGVLHGTWDTLPVELHAWECTADAPCHVDPAQHAAIRNLWHDRLDVQIAATPLWPAAILCLALPAIRLLQSLRTHRRHRRGLCPACGYDLRATPHRCPECGTPTTL